VRAGIVRCGGRDRFCRNDSGAAGECGEAGGGSGVDLGWIDPGLPGSACFDLARAVKARAPGILLYTFSPRAAVNGFEPHRPTDPGDIDSAQPGPADIVDDDDVRPHRRADLSGRGVPARPDHAGEPGRALLQAGCIDVGCATSSRAAADLSESTARCTEELPNVTQASDDVGFVGPDLDDLRPCKRQNVKKRVKRT
jgi:hypothetical protein